MKILSLCVLNFRKKLRSSQSSNPNVPCSIGNTKILFNFSLPGTGTLTGTMLILL